MGGKVILQANAVTLRDADVFGAGRHTHARVFVGRAMGLPEVRSLAIEPATGEARITYRTGADRPEFLARLAAAIAAEDSALGEVAIPDWPDGEAVTLSRSGDLITLLRLIEASAGVLRVAHPALRPRNGAAAQRVARVLGSLPGVLEAASANGNGALKVRFDPARTDAAVIIRAIEAQLFSVDALRNAPSAQPVPFGVANVTVGLGTVGELMLPLATPLAAGILVATQLNTVRDAALDLSRGKVGVPLFHTALLTCSIVTGQVLAYALTEWSLRYWQRRGRKQLAEETQRLLDEAPPLPEFARLLDRDGGERAVPVIQLQAGDRIRVEAGEPIPVDGRVVAGEALVDEALIGGGGVAARKSVGDAALAGCSLLAGGLEMTVERTGSDTVAAQIIGTLVDVATVFPRQPTLRREAEKMADRTVLPTLATAGVGWAAGDLITVGAILHQDWISGPALAVPLLTLNHMRAALRSGALVREGTAIQRLAESDFLVLDGDDPWLTAPGLELAEMESRLPDGDTILRHVAGAGLFLGDERSLALANACRERGLIVRQPALLALEPGRVEARLGEHTIRLTDGPAEGGRHAAALLVEIDGHEVARLSFRRSTRPRAADALQRLRAAGLQTFVVSDAADAAVNELARRLGADWSGGDLDAAGRVRFLQGLRRRGVHPIYVGRLTGQPEVTRQAHVAVDTGGLDGESALGDVVLLGHSYESLADLIELSRGYQPDVVGASRMATLPNLLCVAGAFGGLLNGITAGIIANLGVMNVDHRLRKTLASGRQTRARKLLALR